MEFGEYEYKDLARGARHLAWFMAQTIPSHKGSTSEDRLRAEIARFEALAARCEASALQAAREAASGDARRRGAGSRQDR